MSQNNGLSGDDLRTRLDAISAERATMKPGEYPEEQPLPIQADGLELRTVGWAYRGPRGGLIVTEAKPNHAPEARAVTDLAQAQSALAAMKGEIERMTPKFVAYEYLESPARADDAEARIKALEGALRAVSDTSHMTRDRKHYRLPLAVMERVDAVLSESKGEQK